MDTPFASDASLFPLPAPMASLAGQTKASLLSDLTARRNQYGQWHKQYLARASTAMHALHHVLRVNPLHELAVNAITRLAVVHANVCELADRDRVRWAADRANVAALRRARAAWTEMLHHRAAWLSGSVSRTTEADVSVAQAQPQLTVATAASTPLASTASSSASSPAAPCISTIPTPRLATASALASDPAALLSSDSEYSDPDDDPHTPLHRGYFKPRAMLSRISGTRRAPKLQVRDSTDDTENSQLAENTANDTHSTMTVANSKDPIPARATLTLAANYRLITTAPFLPFPARSDPRLPPVTGVHTALGLFSAPASWPVGLIPARPPSHFLAQLLKALCAPHRYSYTLPPAGQAYPRLPPPPASLVAPLLVLDKYLCSLPRAVRPVSQLVAYAGLLWSLFLRAYGDAIHAALAPDTEASGSALLPPSPPEWIVAGVLAAWLEVLRRDPASFTALWHVLYLYHRCPRALSMHAFEDYRRVNEEAGAATEEIGRASCRERV